MSKEITKPQNHHLVSKHNELTEARYRLSLQQQRLIAFMCAEINPEDKDFKPYSFVIKDFAEIIGLSGENYYTELKKITRDLITKSLTLKEENRTIQVAWLCSAIYYEKEGRVELKFAPELKPYLLQLKECFTQYQLGEILKLRSKYAFRLYELCKKNELLGKYKYEVEKLRELLGVEKGELKLWADFRRYCLEPAIKEINKKTDLYVSYKAEKLGRRFKWVILQIKKREDKQPIEVIESNSPIKDLLKLLPVEQRKKKTIQNAIMKAYKRHGYEYCKRNIEYANKKATDNYRVFLIKALKEDWALGWWEDVKEKEEIRSIMEKIKNAKIEIKGKVYKADKEGFIFMERGVMPPGDVFTMVKAGKAKIIE